MIETGTHLDPDHIWQHIIRDPGGQGQRVALFLDQDGVVIEEVPYLHRVEDVVLISGAAETIAAANREGALVVVITNQGGIGLGHYGWDDFAKIESAVVTELRDKGAQIDAVFACPYHPAAAGKYRHVDHPARKPRPGMIERAARLLGIDRQRSWIIGDKASDIAAGKQAGLRGGVHVLTGCGSSERAKAEELASDSFEVLLAASIAEASGLLRLPVAE